MKRSTNVNPWGRLFLIASLVLVLTPIAPAQKGLGRGDSGPGGFPGDRTRSSSVQIVLEEMTIDAAPGLHSYVVGHGSDGRWLLIGGITEGLHGGTSSSFPEDARNRSVWVIDPRTGSVHEVALDDSGLDPDLKDALSASNHQFAQVGETLWIVGGYGYCSDSSINDHVTFGYLFAVDVDAMIDQIVAAGSSPVVALEDHISWTTRSGYERFTIDSSWARWRPISLVAPGTIGREFPILTPGGLRGSSKSGSTVAKGGIGNPFAVTGGGLEAIGDDLYIVLGHRYAGVYTGTSLQRYSCQVIRFTPPSPIWGGRMSAPGFEIVGEPRSGRIDGCIDDTMASPYRRRDLNVKPAIYLDERGRPQEYIQVLGGVFKHGTTEAYVRPMYITADGVWRDSSRSQEMCQYETAGVSLFDSRVTFPGSLPAGRQITVLLGGMSAKWNRPAPAGVGWNPVARRARRRPGRAG